MENLVPSVEAVRTLAVDCLAAKAEAMAETVTAPAASISEKLAKLP